MISLADNKRILTGAERKAELIGQPMNIGLVDDGGNLVARVRTHRGCTYWLIGACVALFGGSALFGQQAQFHGSVPTGVASPTTVTLTLQDAIESRPTN
jgi:hypothetical protein